MIVNDINKLKVGDVLKLKIITIFLTKLILNLFLFLTEIIKKDLMIRIITLWTGWVKSACPMSI